MTFHYPLLLLVALLPAMWVFMVWKSTARRLTLVLKALSFAAVLLALAEPTLTLPQSKVGAVILVDTSKSVTQDDLSKASAIVSRIERNRGSNWVKLVPFASRTRTLGFDETSRGVHLVPASDQLGDSTNFEAALTSSMSAIPGGYIPRLILISDGNENQGSTARAIAELQRLHVPVDTIPLAGRLNTGLLLETVSLPRIAYAGEQIPIDLTVESPRAASGSVTISVEGKPLGTNPVELHAGLNTLRVHARIKSSGATSISGRIKAGDLGEAPFEHAIELRRARILFLSQDPVGSDVDLLKAFAEAEFEVTRDASLIDRALTTVQLVILNNLDLNTISAERKRAIEAYVKNGGGLLLIGGERQLYKEDKRLDALDQLCLRKSRRQKRQRAPA